MQNLKCGSMGGYYNLLLNFSLVADIDQSIMFYKQTQEIARDAYVR